MSYTFVSAGTISTVGTATPGQPAGKAVGDLLLMATGCVGVSETLNGTPTGWTLILDIAGNGSNRSAIALFARIATGDADDDVSFDFWSGSSASRAQIAAWSGGGHTNLATLMVHSSTRQGQSASEIGTNVATITTANTLVVGFGTKRKTATSDGSTLTSPAGLANRIGFHWNAGTVLGFVWDYTIQTSAADVGGDGWILSINDAATAGYTSMIVSLQSAATQSNAPRARFYEMLRSA